MGHISATYNSVATLFTRDFYLRWRPAATQAQQVHIGRLAVLVVFAMAHYGRLLSDNSAICSHTYRRCNPI